MSKHSFYQIVYSVLFLFLVSCKTTKVANGALVKKNTPTKQLISLHKAADFDFNTLQARLRVNFDDGKKSVAPSISLRMEKDAKIWMSIKVFGFSMGKAYITPDRVSFYVKLNKTYFDGDFKALSQFLGTEVNFKKVQNILTGQSILDLKAKKYKSNWETPDKFVLTPKKDDEAYNFILKLFQKNMRVANYKLTQEEKKVSVNYLNYQVVDKQFFPESIEFLASKPSKEVRLNVDFKGVQKNTDLVFPYEIPEGYKKIAWP